MVDKDRKFLDIKDNVGIVSALQEIIKTKKLNVEIYDSDSLEDIAKKIGIDIEDLQLIVDKKSSLDDKSYQKYPKSIQKAKEKIPSWLDKYDMIELDVRPSLEKGVDPFGAIMQRVSKLDGKILHIINSFEPAPLYSVLGKQGFKHYAREENGTWHIYFYKS